MPSMFWLGMIVG